MNYQFNGTIVTGTEAIHQKHLSIGIGYFENDKLQRLSNIIYYFTGDKPDTKYYTLEYSGNLDPEIKYYIIIECAGFNFLVDLPLGFSSSINEVREINLAFSLYYVFFTGKLLDNNGNPWQGASMSYMKQTLNGPVLTGRITTSITDRTGYFSLIHQEDFGPFIEKLNKGFEIESLMGYDYVFWEGGPTEEETFFSETFYNVKSFLDCEIIRQKPVSNLSKFKKINHAVELSSGSGGKLDLNQSSYLSSKLNLSQDETVQYVRSNNLCIDLNFSDQEILYALCERNNTGDYKELLFKSDDSLVADVNTAIERNIINYESSKVKSQVEDLKKRLISQYIKEPSFKNKYSAIGIISSEDTRDISKKENIVKEIVKWKNDPEGKSMNEYLQDKNLLNPVQYGKAQVFDAVFSVMDGNEAAAMAMCTYNSIDEMIAHKSELSNYIKTSEGQPVTDEDVDRLERKLEREFPSPYLKNEITKHTTDVKPKPFEKTYISDFLKVNSDFQFGERHPLAVLNDPQVKLPDLPEGGKEVLSRQLQRAEQLYHITPAEHKSDWIMALSNAGITSPVEIAKLSFSSFEARISNNSTAFISSDDTRRIYNHGLLIAQQTESVMAELIMNSDMASHVVPGHFELPDDAIEGIPSIKQLFGNQDYFVYPENRNMLSPAAYLMDLFEFLKGADHSNYGMDVTDNQAMKDEEFFTGHMASTLMMAAANNKEFPEDSKLGVLFKRRPDLKHILLNCGNTENVMPYIDLVNEILERAVYEKTGRTISEDLLETIQSTWSSEELAAYPENNQASYVKTVYDNLKSAKTPWNLPFHFWLEEYRTYLKQLSLTREEIIMNFSTGNKEEYIKRGLLDYLGLHKEEIDMILENPNSTARKDYFKNYFNCPIITKDGNVIDYPNGNVAQLISLTGLTYEEIKDLITSYYINPYQIRNLEQTKIRFELFTQPGDKISGGGEKQQAGTLESTFIQTLEGEDTPQSASPDENFYIRLHRFQRLRKTLNLEVYELDLILRYLGVSSTTVFTESYLEKIAYILKIREKLNLKLEEILLLSGDFRFDPYPGYVNLFDFLFLKKTEEYTLKRCFQAVRDQQPLSNADQVLFTYKNIEMVLPFISGIKISEERYNNIVDRQVSKSTDTANNAGLSAIFRVAYLCKALGVTEEEFYFLRDYLQYVPNGGREQLLPVLTDPKTLLEFIEKVEQVKAYGFSIPDLAYLLNGSNLKGNTLYLDEKGIGESLKNLQADLQSLSFEDSLYEKHISKNMAGYFEEDIQTALQYIYEDFGTEEVNTETVSAFIDLHPDLFAGFLKYPKLKSFFLFYPKNTDAKLRAVYYGLGLIDFPETGDLQEILTKEKTPYYSKEDMAAIFRAIKTKILLGILNEEERFDDLHVELPQRFLITSLTATSLVSFTTPSVGMDQRVNSTENTFIQHSPGGKNAEWLEPQFINIGAVDVDLFIRNNPNAFPSDTGFLWPVEGNGDYIPGKMARYKRFVFEKDIAATDEKLARMKEELSHYVEGTEFDDVMEIIMDPVKAFEKEDDKRTMKNFVAQKFGLFMPASEAVAKLYHPGASLEEDSEYLQNYCDRVDLVLDYLFQDNRVDAVILHFVEFCGISEEYIRRFLFKYSVSVYADNKKRESVYAFLNRDFINAETVTRHEFAEQIRLCIFMYRVAQYVKTFKISPEMLDNIFEVIYDQNEISEKFDSVYFMDLTDKLPQNVNTYLNFSRAMAFNHTYFTEDNNFFRFFKENNNLSFLSSMAREYICNITGCSNENLVKLNSQVLQKDKYVEWFSQLLECQRILDHMEVTAATVINLNKTDTLITSKESGMLRQIVKSKYSETEWNNIAIDLYNPLRLKQRDSLRDYLILNSDGQFENSNDLFNYYLIDTEMSTCAKTSRIIQATLSIQLFIQRVLMGFENNPLSDGEKLSFTADEKNELVWRRNYRVWEANRKILFFPENWLDSELRFDKTPIFKEIEEKLTQNDIDDTTAMEAFHEYLDKLEEISDLEIMSVYRDPETKLHELNDIYLVGRTKGSPHKFYFRILKKGSIWTPWQEINNGIKADIVRIIPWKGSIYLFWPEITITNSVPENTLYPKSFKGVMSSNRENDRNDQFTTVRMAWSVYKNGKWSKAIFSEEAYVEPKASTTQNIMIHVKEWYDNLAVYVKFPKPGDKNRIMSRTEFLFDGCRFRTHGMANSGFDYEDTVGSGYIAQFGDMQIEQGKAVCKKQVTLKTSPPKISFINTFGLRYFSKNEPPEHEAGEALNFMETADSFSIINNPTLNNCKVVYDQLACSRKEMARENNNKIFRPLILEDGGNSKTFLGVPMRIHNIESFILQDGTPNLLYVFTTLNHPFIGRLRNILQQKGYEGLFDPNFHDNSSEDLRLGSTTLEKYYGGDDSNGTYFPSKKEIAFSYTSDGFMKDPFATYNWELFYHLPIMIADNLSRNMKFEEAQKWYHLIFDPTIEGKEAPPRRYWRIKPFRNQFKEDGSLKKPSNLEEYIRTLNSKSINNWEDNPFDSHQVAGSNPMAYMKYVVMKYLENLIAWADMYFTKDTMEDINQASLLYILAADILGVRPQKLPGTLTEDLSYAGLLNSGTPNGLSNLYLIIQSYLTVMADYSSVPNNKKTSLLGPAEYRVSYFAAPHNDKMEEYWDMVTDRLFKIRHCMNIQGIVRELPLTAPPIDPGAVAAAMASGADLSSALNSLAAPLPLYRFSYMLQKAMEFTNDVKALGNSLLSVLEKKDAEDMALLRTTHEKAILNAMTAIREKSIEEAVNNIESLEMSKDNVIKRRDYYKNKKEISDRERKALNLHATASGFTIAASSLNALAGAMGAIPQFSAGFPSGVKTEFGGQHLAQIFNSLASVQNAVATSLQSAARETDTMASYERRFEDWQFQMQQAEGELTQLEKQIAGARLRLLMAEHELENHLKQIEHKEAEFEFMKEKFTNKQLYNWMKGQISKLYQQAYQMAHKLALAAEQAFKFEKQEDGYGSYITSSYWDNLKEGLMAGELLYQDLRRLEVKYMETNTRDLELTRDIPLSMIDPEALIELKRNGSCQFEIPEMIYDIDHPGHYMRRIKSVSISIPAVTGPYSGVTCKLSMLNNRFRKSATVGSQYAYTGINDSRFVNNIIGIQSIATSTGNNDAGMFEFNFRDERYLPFEGAGAIGSWRIEMPTAIRKFNYDTISDVIIHVKYTARDAGGLLKEKVNETIEENIHLLVNKLIDDQKSFMAVFSMKSQFADAFNELCNRNNTSITITKEHFPFMITDFIERSEKLKLNVNSVYCTPENKISSSFTDTSIELTDKMEITFMPDTALSMKEDVYMVIIYTVSE